MVTATDDFVMTLDRLPTDVARAAVGPLFEDASSFLARLVEARPFGSAEALMARAREIARSMPEADQVELVNAHPRLGAAVGTLSGHSRREQAGAGPSGDSVDVAVQLDRLNDAYERRFGFRYCVFVAGRPRAALLPGFRAALGGDRRAELARALEAVVDIAEDRLRHLDSLPGGR